MILFLDFDGTTHPFDGKEENLFSCLPRVEKVLREFPLVQVVISSWWRATDNLDMLRSYFSEDIRKRVIGSTPLEEESDCDMYSTVLTVAKPRYQEILEWMKLNAYTGPWVALDDDYRSFPEECANFIRCDSDIGVDEAIEEDLRFYFASFA